MQGDQYTHAYWIRWRETNTGWRTLLRHSEDHCTIVQSGGTELGVYSNRDGGFRGTGAHISPGLAQLFVVTGESSGAGSAAGVSTFYLDGVLVGTADRVCSGMTAYRLGWDGQAPGQSSPTNPRPQILCRFGQSERSVSCVRCTAIQKAHHSLTRISFGTE